MKILRNISILAAAAGLFCGCQELEMVRTYAPEDVVAPALRSIMQGETAVEEITVTSENMGETVTFTWDAADFGVKTQINYAGEAAYGADTIAVLTGLTSTSAQMTYEVLNAPLALAAEDGGLGLTSGTPTEVNFLVSATIGDTFGKYYSEGVPVTMTVTQAERTYPMVYVLGGFSDWENGQIQKLFSFSNDEINYVGIIGFNGKAANGFKIRGTETGWSDDSNWGIDSSAEAPEEEAASIQLISSGGSSDIKAYSKNFYRFSFNRSTLVLTNELSFDQLGVAGDLTGWADGADIVMNFDDEKQVFWADVEFPAEGGFKLRADGAWTIQWGAAAEGAAAATEGLLDGSADIKAPAGNYRLYVNLNNPDEMTWELNADDYDTGGDEPEPEPEPEYDWAVYGNTADSGSDWVDTPMTTKSSMFGVVNVAIPAGGEFLFRDAAQSTYLGPLSSYTTDGSAYTVMVGEGFEVSTDKVNARIADAGSYDFWYVPAVDMAYVAATGEKVGVVPDTYGLVGSVNDWGNSGVGDLAMSEEGGYFVIKGVRLTAKDGFKIRYNNDWDAGINCGVSSGAIDIDTGVQLINDGGSGNISITLEGTYDIYFDKDNLLVYIMTEGSAPETE